MESRFHTPEMSVYSKINKFERNGEFEIDILFNVNYWRKYRNDLLLVAQLPVKMMRFILLIYRWYRNLVGEDNIKMNLQEVGGGCGEWMELAQDRDTWRALVSTVMNLQVPRMRGISWLAAEPVSFWSRTLLHGVSK